MSRIEKHDLVLLIIGHILTYICAAVFIFIAYLIDKDLDFARQMGIRILTVTFITTNIMLPYPFKRLFDVFSEKLAR